MVPDYTQFAGLGRLVPPAVVQRIEWAIPSDSYATLVRCRYDDAGNLALIEGHDCERQVRSHRVALDNDGGTITGQRLTALPHEVTGAIGDVRMSDTIRFDIGDTFMSIRGELSRQWDDGYRDGPFVDRTEVRWSARGELVSVRKNGDAEEWWRFENGRLVERRQHGVTAVFTRDADGRLIQQEENIDDGPAFEFRYAYDTAGRLERIDAADLLMGERLTTRCFHDPHEGRDDIDFIGEGRRWYAADGTLVEADMPQFVLESGSRNVIITGVSKGLKQYAAEQPVVRWLYRFDRDTGVAVDESYDGDELFSRTTWRLTANNLLVEQRDLPYWLDYQR